MRETFLEGMSRSVSSIVLVTTDGEHGRSGMTVSAMIPVSADPPTLLVCVHQGGSSLQSVLDNGVFCVNLLRDTQSQLSDVFARRASTPSGDKFELGDWQPGVTGAPVLGDALAAFECRLSSADLRGSHYILMGDVVQVTTGEPGAALLYANRAYGSPLSVGPVPQGAGEGPTSRE